MAVRKNPGKTVRRATPRANPGTPARTGGRRSPNRRAQPARRRRMGGYR